MSLQYETVKWRIDETGKDHLHGRMGAMAKILTPGTRNSKLYRSEHMRFLSAVALAKGEAGRQALATADEI